MNASHPVGALLHHGETPTKITNLLDFIAGWTFQTPPWTGTNRRPYVWDDAVRVLYLASSFFVDSQSLLMFSAMVTVALIWVSVSQRSFVCCCGAEAVARPPPKPERSGRIAGRRGTRTPAPQKAAGAAVFTVSHFPAGIDDLSWYFHLTCAGDVVAVAQGHQLPPGLAREATCLWFAWRPRRASWLPSVGMMQNVTRT